MSNRIYQYIICVRSACVRIFFVEYIEYAAIHEGIIILPRMLSDARLLFATRSIMNAKREKSSYQIWYRYHIGAMAAAAVTRHHHHATAREKNHALLYIPT